jgi:hypothetical protein
MKQEFENADDGDRPTLTELIADPLIALLMSSDGVDGAGVEAMFARLRTAVCVRRRPASTRRRRQRGGVVKNQGWPSRSRAV